MELLILLCFIIVTIYFFNVYGRDRKELERKGNRVHLALKNTEELVTLNTRKASNYTRKTINKSYLTSCSWILVNKSNDMILYTFRQNDELLITRNGNIDRLKYEFIVNDESILITSNAKEEHFQIKNLKDEILLLQKVSTNQIMIFGNQTKFNNYAKLDIYDIAKKYYFEETKTYLK